MMVKPKVRGFICTTAHSEGCSAHVQQQIDYITQQTKAKGKGPRNVLVIGASTGYGLACRIAATFGYDASTIGVFFEKAASGKRTASAGWYNSAAFEQKAHAAGYYAKSINGDAFSDEIKQQTIDMIKQDWPEGVDLVIYSVASPRRQHPKSGDIYNSVLKPIGDVYNNKTVNVMTGEVSEISIEPANDDDIANTEAVMGGEDWQLWIDVLLENNLLAKGAISLAFSYIGPELTYPVYRHGTIGKAKEHLEATAIELNQKLQQQCGGHAYVSVNKGLVTQASAAIPVVPLYISLLYKVMKEQKNHEGCIEQIWRLYHDRLYDVDTIPLDDADRIRIDDWEMEDSVQQAVSQLWHEVTSDNLESLTDIEGYRQEFYQLFGFGLPGVDYEQEVEIDVNVPSIRQ